MPEKCRKSKALRELRDHLDHLDRQGTLEPLAAVENPAVSGLLAIKDQKELREGLENLELLDPKDLRAIVDNMALAITAQLLVWPLAIKRLAVKRWDLGPWGLKAWL